MPRSSKKTDKSKPHIEYYNPNVEDMINRAAALSTKPAPTSSSTPPNDSTAQPTALGPNVPVPASGSTAPSSTPPNAFVPVPASGSTASSSTPPNALGPNDVGQALPYQKSGNNWMSSTVSIGQDRAYNEVCNFLKDDEVGMVGIYGMGGVGKTTLMEEVDKEFLTPSEFTVIWITVSKTVDMDRIQGVVMENLDLSFNKHDDTRNRAKKINRKLREKKVAILLDDIWKWLDLKQLGILGPEKLNTKSFKLIFTTRSEDVCKQMVEESVRLIQVQCLGWDDSWALFKRSVKNNDIESCDSIIVKLAIEVAQECKGLPLALKVIGGAMACRKRVEEWKHALTTLRRCPTDIPDAEECLFARLKFSFDSLSNRREKACFVYACLYPEDTTLPASFLIECWIGEGILTLNGSCQEAFDEGMNIFGTLQAACLFETIHDDDDDDDNKEEGLRTRIHDVIRDMGIWISKSHAMMNLITLDDGVSRTEKTEPRRFSVSFKDVEWPERAISINLTTFIFLRGEITADCFAFMSKLRVLKLEGVDFDGTPTSIGELTELRHLELIRVRSKGLPNEIRNLRKLQVMRYSSILAMEIIDLPEGIGELIELRKLDVRGVRTVPTEIGNLHKLEELVLKIHGHLELPIEVGNFSKLEILNLYSDDRRHCIKLIPTCIFRNMHKLRDLQLTIKNLKILSTSLFERLTSLERLSVDCRQERIGGEEEDMDDEVAFASFLTQLSAVQQLISLNIKCCPIKEFQVPPTSNTSCVFPRLRRVRISGFYNLEKMQVMSSMALPSIRVLEISFCDSLKHISGLEHLQSLETLKISWCQNLERMQVMSPMALPSIRVLEILRCDSLKHISGLEHLQSLETLKISWCKNLERMQVMSPTALPSIRVLEISSCHSLKHISGLENLQSLETLDVSRCENLGEVIQVAGDHSPPICFPKLKQLECWELPQVKSICSDTVSFPSLQDFTCQYCPGLTRLPRGLVKKNGAAPEQCYISGKREWYNKLQWQDRDFKAALDPHIRDLE